VCYTPSSEPFKIDLFFASSIHPTQFSCLTTLQVTPYPRHKNQLRKLTIVECTCCSGPSTHITYELTDSTQFGYSHISKYVCTTAKETRETNTNSKISTTPSFTQAHQTLPIKNTIPIKTRRNAFASVNNIHAHVKKTFYH
jgi:hypothetical protein